MTNKKFIYYDESSDFPWWFEWMDELFCFRDFSEAKKSLLFLGFTPVVALD